MTLRPRLICLPPAGAGPSLFRSWVQNSESIFDVVPVALPGREAHFTKPLPHDIQSLADHVANEITGLLQAPYALFGYSMGAVVAYELLRHLSLRRLPLPDAFYILGSNAPDRVLEGREPIHSMTSEDFHQSLVEIGGTPDEILRDREAMALFEPVLRNDFRICETYEFTPASAGYIPSPCLRCRCRPSRQLECGRCMGKLYRTRHHDAWDRRVAYARATGLRTLHWKTGPIMANRSGAGLRCFNQNCMSLICDAKLMDAADNERS